MNIKQTLSFSAGALMIFCGVAFSECGEHAKAETDGTCQCLPGFVMNADSGECHHIQSSEVNVLP